MFQDFLMSKVKKKIMKVILEYRKSKRIKCSKKERRHFWDIPKRKDGQKNGRSIRYLGSHNF